MPTAPPQPPLDLGPPFDVRVSERPDDILVTVCGELDLATTPRLTAALGALDGDPRPLLLDLREVTFIDSSALLALTRARVGRPGLRVLPSRSVRRLLGLSGLLEYFGVEDGTMR